MPESGESNLPAASESHNDIAGSDSDEASHSRAERQNRRPQIHAPKLRWPCSGDIDPAAAGAVALRLGLEQAGVEFDKQGVRLNDRLQRK